MKIWQKLDIWGRIFVLCAAAAQIFLVIPLANFDFSVFWYDSIKNQGSLMELILDPEMDYDALTRLQAEVYASQETNNQYSNFHKKLQEFGMWGFAGLFFVGSAMLIFARVMEFEASNVGDN